MFIEMDGLGNNKITLNGCYSLGIRNNKVYIAYLFNKILHDWFRTNLHKFASNDNIVAFVDDMIIFRRNVDFIDSLVAKEKVGKTFMSCKLTIESDNADSTISVDYDLVTNDIIKEQNIYGEIKKRLKNIFDWYSANVGLDLWDGEIILYSCLSLAHALDCIRRYHGISGMFDESRLELDYWQYIVNDNNFIKAMRCTKPTITDDIKSCLWWMNSCKEPKQDRDIKIDLRSLPSCGVYKPRKYIPDMGIKKIIFNEPATIVYWKDGTKTVVKCNPDDSFDPEKGVFVAMLKKIGESDYSGWLDQIKPYIEKYYEKK